MIHWSQNKDRLVVFHGTHIKNVPDILKNGINNKDPKTGMVSVAIGSHGQNIAHGYAAMSGEYGFRQAGQKATTVPHDQRAIVVAHLPMDWVHKNVDRNFGGNPIEVRQRLADPELHRQYVAKTGSDFSPTETPELRFKEEIPAKYIVGVTQKRTQMKTFKEFVESIDNLSDGEKALHSAFIDAGKTAIPRKSASFAIKSEMGPDHAGVTSDVMQDIMLRNVNRKLGKNLSYIEDQHEQAPTTSASGDGTPKIKNFDPVLKFNNIVSMLKRRPPKDTFNHPETAVKDAKRSGSGVPGLP